MPQDSTIVPFFFGRAPFYDETEEERYLYEALGRMSARFAPIDATLDIICTLAFHLYPGKDQLPGTFGRKITFIRERLIALARTSLDQQTLTTLLDDLKSASLKRNEFLHSIATAIEDQFSVSLTNVRQTKIWPVK